MPIVSRLLLVRNNPPRQFWIAPSPRGPSPREHLRERVVPQVKVLAKWWVRASAIVLAKLYAASGDWA